MQSNGQEEKIGHLEVHQLFMVSTILLNKFIIFHMTLLITDKHVSESQNYVI